MSKGKTKKRYWEMNADELAEATKEFDGPIPLSKTRPLNKRERADWERARRRPSRSIYITRSPNDVMVRISPALLKRCRQYAADHKMTLSDVINKSLKGMLIMVG